MKNLIIIVILTLLTSCGAKKSQDLEFEKTYQVYGDSINGRVYLIHGFYGQGSDYLTNENLNIIFNDAIEKDYQVVLFSYPHMRNATFSNAGLDYQNRFKAFMTWMLSDVDAKYGIASENVVIGVSLGGLHSLMTAGLFSDYFDRYAAIVPVTDPTALKELSSVDSNHFNALNFAGSIDKIPGLITYSLDDERVNFRLTEILINDLLNAEVHSTIGTGHSYTLEHAKFITDWI